MITKRQFMASATATAGVGFAGGLYAADGQVVRVPITLSKGGLPLVQLKINKQGPFTFMLDTGASVSMIREDLAWQLGLRVDGKAATGSIKGTDIHKAYAAGEIVLGGTLRVENWRFAGSDAFKEREYDGLLSANILTQLPCQLDYEAREIRYYVGAPMDLTGFGKLNGIYRSEYQGGVEKVYVQIKLPDVSLNLALDTGATGPMMVFGDVVRRHKLWDKYPVYREAEMTGANGRKLKGRLVSIKDVQIGGVWVPEVAAALVDPAEKDTIQSKDHFHGLVGAPFLRAFTVAFTPQKAVYIKRNQNLMAMAPPTRLARASEGRPETSADKPVLGFEYTSSRQILFRLTGKGGLPTIARLDTGAESSIGEALAVRLGLSAMGGYYQGAALSIQGMSLEALRFKVAPNPKSGVVLGLDFLRLYPSLLDFDTNSLVFFKSGDVDTGGFERLTVTKASDGRLIVAAKLMGKDTQCLMQTGTAYGLWLPPQTVRARNLWDAFPKAEDRLAYSDPQHFVKTRFTGVSGFELGSYRIDPCPVTFSDPVQTDDQDMVGAEAVMGMGLLRRFNSLYDRDGNVWFKANRHFNG